MPCIAGQYRREGRGFRAEGERPGRIGRCAGGLASHAAGWASRRPGECSGWRCWSVGWGRAAANRSPKRRPIWAGSARSARAACDLYAATEGSDSAPGSRSRPFRTAQRLVRALRPEQTGCFRGGTYTFSRIKLVTPRITLAPYGDDAVTLEGEIKVLPAGAGSTIEGLKLNGASGTRQHRTEDLRRRGDSARQRDHQRPHEHLRLGVAVVLGPPAAGRDHRAQPHPRLRAAARPPTRTMASTSPRPATRVIRDNWIYDNADRGIQLYPDADGSTITGNVIDSNGEGIVFAGDGPDVSSDNLVDRQRDLQLESRLERLFQHRGRARRGQRASATTASGRATPCPTSTPTAASSPRRRTSSRTRTRWSIRATPIADAHDYTLSPESECPLARRPGLPALGGAG